MTIKEQLITEIDRLDESNLELLFNIIRQLPHGHEQEKGLLNGQKIALLFQEIADSGGLGIENPKKWHKDIRKDRPLPFREV
ncbi:MAG: hypothetical protein HOD92_13770 [Deltaproteobacteria bacterium]|mgnify:CR=1 FL=1|jgi:hypothetical protein|nr:hypothetical protein [Deltaproteobacteria bacterium]